MIRVLTRMVEVTFNMTESRDVSRQKFGTTAVHKEV